jgi:mono/diheme cytochrome c family protein
MTRKLLVLLAAASAALVPVLPLAAEPAQKGRALYGKYCASCHGLDGRGATELAKLFEKDAPDLTRIATRRGGWFPEVLVEEIVDGRFAAHGGRQMPVWGETLTRDEIILVTEYIYAIQDNPTSVAP